MADKIQLRRDTTANWDSVNPILSSGEIGIDTTLQYLKIGDGISHWNSISYNLTKSAADNLYAPINYEPSVDLSEVLTTNTGRIPFSNGTSLADDSLLVWDNTNKRLGVGTNTPNSQLEVFGALRLSGYGTDLFHTPVGANVATKINIPLLDPGSFGQIIMLGLPIYAQASSRVLSLVDARTVIHQPTLAVFNPSEDDVLGFSWDGDTTKCYLKSLAASIWIRVNTHDIAGFGYTSKPAIELNGTTWITDPTEHLRLKYDSNNYASFTVDSSGNLLIDAIGSIKLGDGTNQVKIASDGTLTLEGTATSWDDLLIEMKESLKGDVEKPDWDSTNFGFLFPRNDTSVYIVLNVQLPHKWKVGSTIYPHVHFFQNQNVTPTFKMDYRWINIGDEVSGFTTGYTMNTLVGSQVWTTGQLHRIVNNPTGIDGTNKGISSMLQIKFYRDDDVYVGDCLVVSFDIHIEVDSFGSSLEYTK